MGNGQKITLILMSVIFLGQIYWTQGEDFNHYTATGQRCYNACRLHGGQYYWCNTRKGWDYCSLTPNTDCKGIKCKDDHPCDLHGKKYYWCNNQNEEFYKCGKVELRTLVYRSATYLSECRDDCSLDDSNSYYWCNTDKGWDYCSPSEDVTYKNKPCRADHRCDTHGLGYSWCRTESSWDYCGIINTSGINGTPRRQKRQPQDIVEICRKIDLGNKRMTTITAEKVNTLVFDNNWRNDIIHIISRYNNSFLRDQAGTILKTRDFRIDIQGLIKRNNQKYYNLQIQKNIERPKGKSTSVALVITPQSEDVPDRYVRRAFTESFTRGAKVSVDVKPYDNKPGKRGRNCN